MQKEIEFRVKRWAIDLIFWIPWVLRNLLRWWTCTFCKTRKSEVKPKCKEALRFVRQGVFTKKKKGGKKGGRRESREGIMKCMTNPFYLCFTLLWVSTYRFVPLYQLLFIFLLVDYIDMEEPVLWLVFILFDGDHKSFSRENNGGNSWNTQQYNKFRIDARE